jgi:hypothetical protein
MEIELQPAVKSLRRKTRPPAWQPVAGFTFGTVFCIALLVLAFVFPEPTPFQYTICRIILALAVAGVAALVPGFLHISLRGSVRAGGALGVFVIVYFFSPASLVATPKLKNLATTPEVEIASWFQLVDAAKYDEAWERASTAVKDTMPKAAFKQLFEAQRTPLGHPNSERLLYSISPAEALPDGRRGNFRIYGYKTVFSNSSVDMVEWLLLGEENKVWRIMSHNVAPVPTQK